MTNIFDNIITPEFKNIFNDAIDHIVSNQGLTIPCILKYYGQNANETKLLYCYNCIFDPISQLSANTYNRTGPNSFPDGSICPVCMGNGTINSDFSEKIMLACIFDSKYFLNWSSKSLNISTGYMQTICLSSLLSKIRNANELVIDSSIAQYGNYKYDRAGDPEIAGLGSDRYIITMWKRK